MFGVQTRWNHSTPIYILSHSTESREEILGMCFLGFETLWVGLSCNGKLPSISTSHNHLFMHFWIWNIFQFCYIFIINACNQSWISLSHWATPHKLHASNRFANWWLNVVTIALYSQRYVQLKLRWLSTCSVPIWPSSPSINERVLLTINGTEARSELSLKGWIGCWRDGQDKGIYNQQISM